MLLWERLGLVHRQRHSESRGWRLEPGGGHANVWLQGGWLSPPADAGPTRKGLKQLLQASCSAEVRQDSFAEPLLQTFWGAFCLISEHWSQARRSQNITKQEISLLEPVCLPYIALADWKMSLEAWALEEPEPSHALLWAHTASQEHHS